ncbi:MAG: outer membrane beta-barrel protein [Bacteroidota bacterium]
MKKIVLAFTFLLFYAAGSLSAQKTFRFGFQTSPTWSWMRTDDKKLEGVSSNWGIRVGAVGEYYFATNYAITAGLGFGFNQGGTIQNDYPKGKFWPNAQLIDALKEVSQNTKLHYRINYVEIPFGLKMRGGSGEDNPLKFYAEIPTFTLGFISKATGDIVGDKDLPAANADDANDINIRDDIRKISLAWGVGGGIEYELAANATLVVGLAYQQQFTDVTKNTAQLYPATGDPISDGSKATIRFLSLRMGIFF